MPLVHLGSVDSIDDPRLSDYRNLTDVQLRLVKEPAEGLYIAESSNVLQRAIDAGHAPRSFLLAPRWVPNLTDILERFPSVPAFVAPEAILEAITGFDVHRGVLAAMHRPAARPLDEILAAVRRVPIAEDMDDYTEVSGRRIRDGSWRVSGSGRSRIAVFEDLSDHTNIGAAFRSAAALGVDAVLVTPRCADPLYRRSIRVSMGTVFQVPWTRVDEWPAGLDTLKQAGYLVAGMTLGEGAITLDGLVAEDHEKLALVFGNEGHGLTAATDRRVDRRVMIPMMGGVDSLNVAASSAVAFYATK